MLLCFMCMCNAEGSDSKGTVDGKNNEVEISFIFRSKTKYSFPRAKRVVIQPGLFSESPTQVEIFHLN